MSDNKIVEQDYIIMPKEYRGLVFIRRLDDLGRVVIPKDLRKFLGWNEGDPLQIEITPDNSIHLKKQLPYSEVNSSKE